MHWRGFVLLIFQNGLAVDEFQVIMIITVGTNFLYDCTEPFDLTDLLLLAIMNFDY